MMKTQKKQKTPPCLPEQWSTSYISYWEPMQEEDQITSGYCWFDYTQNVCRIDGLFNPWSEKETGHRLWMSEIITPQTSGDFNTHKKKIAYTRKTDSQQSSYNAIPLEDELDSCLALLLSQDILIQHNATYAGTHTILGIKAHAWTFTRPKKGPSTYYFKQGTNHLIRMVTGDPSKHASIRDFPNFNCQVISESIFEHHKP